jgi:uncharacterized Zn-binding protein involved in type VI secretion
MAAVHRHGDARTCGATTVVSGQSSVFVNDQLWAVEDDQNTHNNGELIATTGFSVQINGIRVIVVGDQAQPDGIPHANPSASSGSGDVSCY